ncbi:glycosyltransferase family 4 protein [Acidisoma cellulosilytica]|uniref:Glycosyltransferase family 4 protein n=1 Tax=Acidisoma cellulosilyticum TaxID=2802395 RepID=A0A963Z699_9PROT|nr:glycosyltransferase family 4 protein [Acidisoma cellulosilyticum]MCB8883639.1 glycosyltransferase family 4 protein [Acidisoma cellulosilyticum]
MIDATGREVAFAIPGDIDTRTGGYGYDRRLIAGLREQGFSIRHLPWPGSFPYPTASDLAEVAASLASRPDGEIVLIDGLALGAMPELAAAEGQRLRLIALVHHPLALEPLAPRRFVASEREALRHVRAVIVTSDATAEVLRDAYGVSAERLIVAPPGTDTVLPAARQGDPPHILSLGSVTPRKDHTTLVSALSAVRDLEWRCTIAGSLDRAPETVAALRAQIDAFALRTRIILVGEVEDTGPLYADADLFVLASLHEGYGMVFAEALAHGLPVIGTLAGAIPSVVPEKAGALVPPKDGLALAIALRRLLTDPAAREQASSAALQAAAALPGWENTVSVVTELLRRLG